MQLGSGPLLLIVLPPLSHVADVRLLHLWFPEALPPLRLPGAITLCRMTLY